MLTSIMASLVAVPVASTNISGDYKGAVGMVAGMEGENTSDVPRRVSENVSSDGFTKTVETGFGSVNFKAEGTTFTATLENPGTTVKTVKKPGEKLYILKDSDVKLRKTESGTGSVERCKTPFGTLKTGTELGGKKSSFDGVKRQESERLCEEARENLEESVQKIGSVSAETGLVKEQVEVSDIDPEEEYIEITNTGFTEVSLKNWTVSDEADNSFEDFGETTLETGESVKIYSGDAYEECEELCWHGGIIWNKDGDSAELRNSEGELVDSYSY